MAHFLLAFNHIQQFVCRKEFLLEVARGKLLDAARAVDIDFARAVHEGKQVAQFNRTHVFQRLPVVLHAAFDRVLRKAAAARRLLPSEHDFQLAEAFQPEFFGKTQDGGV